MVRGAGLRCLKLHVSRREKTKKGRASSEALPYVIRLISGLYIIAYVMKLCRLTLPGYSLQAAAAVRPVMQ